MTDELITIGKYVIASQLGKGAMGTVYKGYDRVISRYVAIKTLTRQGNDAERAELAARFKQEAQAAGRLNHPGIVAVYDYGEEGDLAYIAMELVEGYTLAEQTKRHIQLSLQDIWDLVLKVLDALDYAHSKGVIHRDIKPSNIMRTTKGDVKITDFGIAHIDTSELTKFGTVIGTPGYMSPEQLMGKRVDHRTDIFSCGILLYELLTGVKAFTGTDISSIIHKVVHTELPPASKQCPDLPEAIDAVLARALAKNPEQRFATAGEFARAIRAAALHEKETGTTDYGAGIPDPATQTAVVPAETTRATEIRPDTLQGLDTASGIVSNESPTLDSAPPAAVGTPKPGKPQASSRSWSKKPVWIGTGVAVLVVAVLAVLAVIRTPGTGTRQPQTTPPASVSVTPATGESAQPVPAPVAVSPSAAPAYRPGSRFSDCDSCPEMIVVPAGSFLQGSPDSEHARQPNEGPQRTVHIDYPLAVGQFEVTRQQFARFAEESGYQGKGCMTYDGSWKERDNRSWKSPGYEQNDSDPVTCVSWEDARGYADWLSGKTGHRYRLLSASEWEYIARAGAQSSRSWGDDPDAACRFTNVADRSTLVDYPGWQVHHCTDGYVYTAPADAVKPNAFGVSAMLGNLFEWVDDCWHDSYRGAPTDGSAWAQGDCEARALRGGSWYSRPEYVRSAFRNHFDRATRASTFGIRVAREIPRG
ncbi:MAG: SUMF1/EgtB/PvdO family nonheme iron enzyme [Thiogranum sp.]|jgi:serine/threonine-protein kinase